MGWDILCFGRPASRDFFREGSIETRLRISRRGEPLLIECLRVNNREDMLRPSGQRGFIVTASFFASNCSEEVLSITRDSLSPREEGLCGATLLADLLVVRYLGNSVEEARTIFLEIWRRIRPVLLGKDACPPRIWST